MKGSSKELSTRQKRLLRACLPPALLLTAGLPVNAMHIMEGYLPPVFCIAWGAVCIPFVTAGIMRMNNLLKEDRRRMVILAIAGAFTFILSALKLPSVTGSCSHMTGTGLAAILFGPGISSVLGLIVLLFQALLLAHGGITTLGANLFSMGIAGPVLTWVLWKGLKKTRMPVGAAIFTAAMLGDLFTYCVTSLQLALAYPSTAGGVLASLGKFMGIFALTQVPLAIVEGILTYLIISALEAYADKDMKSLGFLKQDMGRKIG